jgi:arylsulfatase A-like enzyme
LLGDEAQEKHEYLYWEFNESKGPLQALRKDDWKWIKKHNKQPELYNLSDDIGETNNLAKQKPELVAKLSTIVDSARTYHPEFTLKKLPSPYKKKAKKAQQAKINKVTK